MNSEVFTLIKILHTENTSNNRLDYKRDYYLNFAEKYPEFFIERYVDISRLGKTTYNLRSHMLTFIDNLKENRNLSTVHLPSFWFPKYPFTWEQIVQLFSNTCLFDHYSKGEFVWYCDLNSIDSKIGSINYIRYTTQISNIQILLPKLLHVVDVIEICIFDPLLEPFLDSHKLKFDKYVVIDYLLIFYDKFDHSKLSRYRSDETLYLFGNDSIDSSLYLKLLSPNKESSCLYWKNYPLISSIVIKISISKNDVYDWCSTKIIDIDIELPKIKVVYHRHSDALVVCLDNTMFHCSFIILTEYLLFHHRFEELIEFCHDTMIIGTTMILDEHKKYYEQLMETNNLNIIPLNDDIPNWFFKLNIFNITYILDKIDTYNNGRLTISDKLVQLYSGSACIYLKHFHKADLTEQFKLFPFHNRFGNYSLQQKYIRWRIDCRIIFVFVSKLYSKSVSKDIMKYIWS